MKIYPFLLFIFTSSMLNAIIYNFSSIDFKYESHLFDSIPLDGYLDINESDEITSFRIGSLSSLNGIYTSGTFGMAGYLSEEYNSEAGFDDNGTLSIINGSPSFNLPNNPGNTGIYFSVQIIETSTWDWETGDGPVTDIMYHDHYTNISTEYNQTADIHFASISSATSTSDHNVINIELGVAAVDSINVVFNTVPEPSTYTLILGAVALGFTIRRRKYCAV
ncbi:MAG: hypothetical protein CML08_04320 [Puniceicoccaceae bacterium]|mgnify:FL=1|nr:hypothetical protein [Puniceicoccaceae bacterium]|tara:strand:- start:144 stop:806 length:663 start_codon:yes stop_codon:yes gene_type:complete